MAIERNNNKRLEMLLRLKRAMENKPPASYLSNKGLVVHPAVQSPGGNNLAQSRVILNKRGGHKVAQRKKRLTIKEVPIEYKPRIGQSKLNALKDGVRILARIFKGIIK